MTFICILISYTSLCEIRKGSLAAFSIQHSTSKEKISAKSYIQNGLIAHWDGIENAGYGLHDDNALIWKDLIGQLDLQCNRKPIWTTNEVVISSWNTYFYVVADLISDAFNNHSVTIEVLYGDVISAANNTGPFGIGDPYFSQAWPFYIQQNRAANTACNIYALGSSVWQPSAYFLGHENGANCLVSISIDGSSIIARSIQPDEFQFSATRNSSFTSQIAYGSIFAIGRSYSQQAAGYCVKCVRVYNRALSGNEMQYNYKIDKVRFEL